MFCPPAPAPAGGTPPSEGGRQRASDAHPSARGDWGPPGGWEGVGSLPTLTHRQSPITLEYQIHPPTIDTLVTGMALATEYNNNTNSMRRATLLHKKVAN